MDFPGNVSLSMDQVKTEKFHHLGKHWEESASLNSKKSIGGLG